MPRGWRFPEGTRMKVRSIMAGSQPKNSLGTGWDPLAGKLIRKEHRRDAAYRRAYPLVWWLTLLVPVVAAAVILSLMALLRGMASVLGLIGLAVSSLFFGKFIILGGTNGSAVLLSPEELVILVVAMDVMTACWFVYHLGFMRRIPLLGPRITVLVEDGEAMLAAYPRLRRLAFLGLVIFVMIPFAMTGSVGGSILALLLGMARRATFLAISLGSVLGALFIYFGGRWLPDLLDPANPAWSIGGILVIVAVILLVNYRYARARQRLRQSAEKLCRGNFDSGPALDNQ